MMEDDDRPVLYRCPVCKRIIGSVDECGALVIDGIFRTLRVDLVCACGRVLRFRRTDVKLDWLVERVLAMHQSGY